MIWIITTAALVGVGLESAASLTAGLRDMLGALRHLGLAYLGVGKEFTAWRAKPVSHGLRSALDRLAAAAGLQSYFSGQGFPARFPGFLVRLPAGFMGESDGCLLFVVMSFCSAALAARRLAAAVLWSCRCFSAHAGHLVCSGIAGWEQILHRPSSLARLRRLFWTSRLSCLRSGRWFRFLSYSRRFSLRS